MRFKRHNAWAARRKVIPTAPPNEGRFCALNVSENDRVASPRSRLRWRATPRQALYSSFTRWRKRRSSRPDPPAPWKRKLGTLRNLRSLFDRSLYYPPSFSLRSFIPRLPLFFFVSLLSPVGVDRSSIGCPGKALCRRLRMRLCCVVCSNSAQRWMSGSACPLPKEPAFLLFEFNYTPSYPRWRLSSTGYRKLRSMERRKKQPSQFKVPKKEQ